MDKHNNTRESPLLVSGKGKRSGVGDDFGGIGLATAGALERRGMPPAMADASMPAAELAGWGEGHDGGAAVLRLIGGPVYCFIAPKPECR
jgi:hypothetical protein